MFVKFTGASVAFLTSVFVLGMAQAKARGLPIDCGCFGGGGRGDGVGWLDILRDIPMVLAGVYLWRRPHGPLQVDGLSRLVAEYPAIRLVTVVTSIGARPGPSPDEYMASEGLSFPVAVDDAGNTLGAALGVQAFPLVYYLEPGGRVAAMVEGRAGEQQIRAHLDHLGSLMGP